MNYLVFNNYSKVTLFINNKNKIYKLIYIRYIQIFKYDDSEIIIDNKKIIGDKMIIEKMEDEIIEVVGEITKIETI